MLMDARRFAVTECNGLSHGARIHISEILDEGNKRQEYEHTLVQVLSNQFGSAKKNEHLNSYNDELIEALDFHERCLFQWSK